MAVVQAARAYRDASDLFDELNPVDEEPGSRPRAEVVAANRAGESINDADATLRDALDHLDALLPAPAPAVEETT